MSATETLNLPVLPLTAGVVGPGMVVTIALETPEASVAADAAMEHTGRLLLVPRIDGAFARVGTVAKIEDVGDIPGTRTGRALVVRGLERAVIGTGVPGEGRGLWVSAEPVIEGAEPTEEARRLAREYKAVVEAILDRRGASRMAEGIRSIREPGALADISLYSPDLSLEQKVEILEELDVEARLRKVLAWAKESLEDLTVRADINREVSEGFEK